MILSIGVMQGRVVPPPNQPLQTFPVSTWLYESLRISEAGYDHVELLWDKMHSIKTTKSMIKKIQEFSNLKVQSIILDSLSECIDIKKIIDEIKDSINFFQNSNLKVFVIPLINKNKDQFFYKDLIQEIIHSPEFKKINKKHIFSFETNYPYTEIINLFKQCNTDLIGCCLDTGNLWHESLNPINDLNNLIPFVNHIHIKDKDQNGNNVYLGEGIVDFQYIFNLIRESNYSGLVTLETNFFKNPYKDAIKNLNFVKTMLNYQ